MVSCRKFPWLSRTREWYLLFPHLLLMKNGISFIRFDLLRHWLIKCTLGNLGLWSQVWLPCGCLVHLGSWSEPRTYSEKSFKTGTFIVHSDQTSHGTLGLRPSPMSSDEGWPARLVLSYKITQSKYICYY